MATFFHKMKKLLLLLVFTVFLPSGLYSENVLVLTKPDLSQSHIFRKGSFLVFKLKSDGSICEGFIRDITDSALVFDHAQVSVSQILPLAGSTKGKIIAGRIANALANGLILTGSILLNCGLDIFVYSDSYYYWPLGGAIWFGGAVIAGIGHAFDWITCPFDYVVRVRNYRGWIASISSSSTSTEDKINQSVQQETPNNPNSVTKDQPQKEEKRKQNIFRDDVYE